MNAEDFIGQVIRQRRQGLGMTIQTLADSIDSDVGNVSRAETGKQKIPSGTLEEIAKVLGTTASEIWVGAEVMERMSRNNIGVKDESPVEYAVRAAHLQTIQPKDRVPVISWVQAGAWSGIYDNTHPYQADEWLPCPVTHSKFTFALIVRGESMSNPHSRPSFHDGDIIFVDPERPAEHGSLVVVRLNATAEATFKKLIIEGDRRFLKALNPAWPESIIAINGNATICGVVIFKGEKI